jgi:hypothetical protein
LESVFLKIVFWTLAFWKLAVWKLAFWKLYVWQFVVSKFDLWKLDLLEIGCLAIDFLEIGCLEIGFHIMIYSRSHFGPIVPSACQMAVDVPHETFLKLVDRGPGNQMQLWHRGTGEHVVVEEACELLFVNGSGILEPRGPRADARDVVWANDRLDLSLHTDGGDKAKVFIWSKSKQEKTMVRPDSPTIGLALFSHICNAGAFSSEIYVHIVPTEGAMATRYWTTPWLQNFLHEGESHNRWACRNYDSWLTVLRPSTPFC